MKKERRSKKNIKHKTGNKKQEDGGIIMNKSIRKAISFVMMTAMLVIMLPQNMYVQAAHGEENKTESAAQDVSIDYSELNNEIYDNLEDYPVGNMQNTGIVYEDAIQVNSIEEYYEAVGEKNPLGDDGTAVQPSLSSAVDNSTNENAKYFPPIVSQLGGSCTCYAFIYNLGSYTINQARGTDASQSKNQLCPLFVYNMTRSTSSTGVGTSQNNANRVIKNIGVPTADVAPISYNYSNYAYTWYPTEEIWTSAVNHRIGSAIQLRDIPHTGTPITSANDPDLDLLKTTLSYGKIVAFATAFSTFNYTVIPPQSPSHAGEAAVDRCDYYVSNGSGGRNYGGHAMVIVGYDDNIWIDVNRDGKKQTGEYGAFKIANSHGTGYKNSGFVWVAYDALNSESSVITDEDQERVNAAIDAGTMTGNKIQNQYREEFFWYSNYCYTYTASSDNSESSGCQLVTTLNTSDRGDVSMVIAATKKSTGERSSYTVEPFNITNWSTAYALDGSQNATDGTIVTDLNNVISNISRDTIDDYTWSVVIEDKDASSAPLTVKDLRVTSDGVEILTAEVENDVLDGISKTYMLDASMPLKITDFTVSKNSPVSLTEYIGLSATATGGSGNYQYRFGSIFNGKEYEINGGYKEYASATLNGFSYLISSGNGSGTAEAVGTHTLFVDIKDTETGAVVRKTIENYQVKPLTIKSFTADKVSPQSVGTAIELNAEVEYEATYRYNTYKFYTIKDGVETCISQFYTGTKYSFTWTPKEAGTYTLKYYIRDNLGQEATATMDYVVKDQKSVIYYKNDYWDQAYIHYKVGNGEWTAVPGVKMENNTSGNGYTWKYTIDLGSADGATVCFNNGNGSWDSQNGANYSVGIGSYGFKNGNKEELQEGISLNVFADRAVGGTYNKSVFTAEAENGTAPYTYQFVILDKGTTPSDYSYATVSGNTYEYTPYSAREYTIFVKVTDAEGKTAKTSMDYTVEGHKWGDFTATADNHKVGTRVKLQAEYINFQPDSYNSYSFAIEKNGTKTEYGTGAKGYLEWIPQEEGIYTITARFHSFAGATYEKTMEYIVSNGNIATVYYNSNWDNAYIHYCVAGKSWTAVPGVIMEKSTEKEGYNYKYVIDLGEASTVQVCFNNGNGSWDSRNGANYTVNTGTCGISNGNIVTLQ